MDVEEDATKNGSYVPRLNKNHGFLHSIKRNQHQRDQFEKDLKAKQEKQRLEREKERAVETPNKDDRVGLDDDLSEEYTPKIYGSRKNLTEEAPHLSPHSDQTWDHTGWEEMQRDRRRSFGKLNSILLPFYKIWTCFNQSGSPAKNSGRGRGRGRYQEQRLSYSPQKQPPPRFSDKNQRNDKNQNSNKQIAPKEEKEKVERKKRDTVQAYVPPRGKYSNTSPIVLILNFEVETGKEPQTLYVREESWSFLFHLPFRAINQTSLLLNSLKCIIWMKVLFKLSQTK